MKVLSKHKTAMERQNAELVRIETEKVDILLNSKDEWNGSKIPRVVLEIGDEQWRVTIIMVMVITDMMT